MSFQNPNRQIPATFDAGAYGKDLTIDLVDPRLTGVQTFTMSASTTVHRTNVRIFKPDGTNNTNYTALRYDTNSVLTDLDTGLIVHKGNNTAFNQDYTIPRPVTAAVTGIEISAAFILNVSNWVDGTPALLSVSFTVASYKKNGGTYFPPETRIFEPSSAFSALGANGAHLFIVRGNIPYNFRVDEGAGALTLNITVNTSGTSANDTYQVGIVDMYPTAKSSAAKRLFPSQLKVHIVPLPENLKNPNEVTEYELGGTGVRK